ncbi:MAG TPA: S8 family serine peptidase [Solirubrobacteraceae bacterium]
MPAPLRPPIAALVAAAILLALPAVAAAAGPRDAQYRAGQVVVHFAADAGPATRTAAERAAHAGAPTSVTADSVVLRVRVVAAAVRTLRAQPGVLSATPNYLASVSSGWIPRDPGRSHRRAGWEALQWNFLPGTGVDAPDAWLHLMNAGRPGGKGVVVAVVDTGVAYATHGRFRRSPDFRRVRFVPGRDFVANDRRPSDENGHGTHVAGTIAETTDNGIGVTGLAYRAKIMPIRVLDSAGNGDSATIARGIRWAADHGAQVINLSFEFGSNVTRWDIPDIISALRHARRKGVLVIGAAGNGKEPVAYPARSTFVMSVGATTKDGCKADYSDTGSRLDIVAPGGGDDAELPQPNCDPAANGPSIYQMTFTTSVRRFGLPGGYFGTSMAAPHVSAAAALVIASGILGPKPTPDAVAARLEHTATDLGTPGRDDDYGWGLLNAARATDPAVQ